MREFDKEKFKKDFRAILLLDTDKKPETCSSEEAMDALTKYVTANVARVRLATRNIQKEK